MEYIRINEKLYKFPDKPNDKDIYKPELIDGIPTWVIDQEAEKQEKRLQIMEKIELLEQSQARSLREMVVEPNDFAKNKLKDIDEKIKKLREKLEQ